LQVEYLIDPLQPYYLTRTAQAAQACVVLFNIFTHCIKQGCIESHYRALQIGSLSGIPACVQARSFSPKGLLRSLISFLALATLFAIGYSQSPLYTSNQNQYFLHGLAAAGYGNLSEDWLANTLDPTPVFSKLVELSYRLLHLNSVFYGYYALLMGIYLYSLIGIADRLLNLRASPAKSLAFTALLITVHSAGLRFALSRWLGTNWTYVLEDGVADQRMLGPVFQPSAFGVFLALSVYLFLLRRPYWALLAAAVAVYFHPTYLLSVAMLTLSYALAAWPEERNLRQPVQYGLFALLLVSPVVYAVYTSFGGSSPEASARAQEILVSYRIPHHALVSWWLDATVLVKLTLVASAIALGFRWGRSQANLGTGQAARRLAWVLLATTLMAIALTLVQVATRSNALALLFPWRISILVVPVSTALLLAFLVERGWGRLTARARHFERLVSLLSTIAIFLVVLVGGIRFTLDLQRKVNDPESSLEAFVYAQRSPGDLYLTPVKMQDFRLESGAPAFVDFKSIPYKDSDVLEWYRRVRLAERFYANGDCSLLERLVREEGITHIVVEAGATQPSCSGIEAIYQDGQYILWGTGSP
jgi:hypothetical protein